MNRKVLLLSYRLGYDSLLYWDSILSAIKDKFDSFRVFTAHSPIESKNKLLTTEKKLTGITYHKNPTKTYGKLYFLPMPLFVIDIIKFKPDVIILNEFNLANFYALFFKLFYKRTKFLLLVESDPGIGHVVHEKNTIRYYYRKHILKKVDLVLTNNQLGVDYLTKYIGLNPAKVKKAPYLTSCPETSVKERDINKTPIKFLYVGRLIQGKGLIYLLKALNSLPIEIKNIVHVDIIGGGDLETELQDYVNKYKLDFVQFRGKLPFDKLSDFYHNADCFVLPTLGDYRALVGFEALCFGCAIIDSIYDGARFEVVEEGKNGYIVDPKNIEEFKDAILKIVLNEEDRKLFKEYSLKKSNDFTTTQCNTNLINAIKELE